jgi:hypothetical protein
MVEGAPAVCHSMRAVPARAAILCAGVVRRDAEARWLQHGAYTRTHRAAGGAYTAYTDTLVKATHSYTHPGAPCFPLVVCKDNTASTTQCA